MAFLEINSANPAQKRPFRISDLQDIWAGIAAIFKPLRGDVFRVISGFDLDGYAFASGTILYKGNLYEYDSTASEVIGYDEDNRVVIYFAKLAIDPRQLQNGSTQDFAFKYVCGGSTFEGVEGYVSEESASFALADIERSKTYVGKESITTDNLQNGCVTNDKLSTDAKMLSVSPNNPLVLTSLRQDVPLSELRQGSSYVKYITAQNTVGINVRIDTFESGDLPNFVPFHVVNPASYPVTVRIRLRDIITNEGATTRSYVINAGETLTKLLIKCVNGGYVITD